MSSLLTWLFGLWAVLGFGPAPSLPNLHHSHHHRPSVTRPAPSPSGSVAPTPLPLPSPSPSPAIAAGPATAEIASEQICPGQSDPTNTNTALNCLTNNARKFHSLGAVASNPALQAAAAAKGQDMLKCGYGHEACGNKFDAEMKAAGYTGQCVAENIAQGQKSPHDVFVAWMNSPGHRANILNGQYKDLGVSEVSSSNGPLWTMELGGC